MVAVQTREHSLTDISALRTTLSLETLHLINNGALHDLTPLHALSRLHEISLHQIPGLTDTSLDTLLGTATLANLRILDIYGGNVTSVPMSIENMVNLTHLRFEQLLPIIISLPKAVKAKMRINLKKLHLFSLNRSDVVYDGQWVVPPP